MIMNDFKEVFLRNIESKWICNISDCTEDMIRTSLADTIRELYINKDWIATEKKDGENLKQVYYLCTEYLPEKYLKHNLFKLGILDEVKQIMKELNIDLDEIIKNEIPPREGVGGLSRLASCLGESGALLDKPFHMYGLRYKEGLFNQKVSNGYQVELVDSWRKLHDYPWQILRPNKERMIKIGGNVELQQIDGKLMPIHKNYMPIRCIAYDMPIVSADLNTHRVNTLRMWDAKGVNDNKDPNASSDIFTSYEEHKKYLDYVDSILDTLYPNDKTQEGRDKRFLTEMILTMASVGDIVDNYISNNGDIHEIGKNVSIQINDTMPTFSILELFRLLLDEFKLPWEECESICREVFFYTCHTILSEALQKCNLGTFWYFAPRHAQILEEIARRDNEQIGDLQIIQGNMVHYANLCLKFSKKINGVAPLHGEVLREKVFKHYSDLNEGKVIDILNGVAFNYWVKEANPKLGELITNYIGDSWIKHSYDINQLSQFKNNKHFREEIRHIKYENKKKLMSFIKGTQGIDINPHSCFMTFCKRTHLYKRNDLYICLILNVYNELLKNINKYGEGITFFMSGKSAFGYQEALDLIKIYNEVANMVNNDNRVNHKIKVIFIPNYGMDIAELLIPATDLKADISCVLYEASGSSCFKSVANCGVSIGTDDGANVDIIKEVGLDAFYKFGMEIPEAKEYMYKGKHYDRWEAYSQVSDVIDYFRYNKIPNCHFETERLWNRLINIDFYFVMKDLPSFTKTFDRAMMDFRNRELWIDKMIDNLSRSGMFNINRTFEQYCEIWGI